MKLSTICIQRPVFATVLSLVIVLVGLVCYERLSVREYPKIDPPVVSVSTDYPGASAEIIETQITQVLEDSLSGIDGVDYISSSSRQERSQITITFTLDRDASAAAADVRDRVSRVRGRLPDAVEEPVIQKVEADAQPTVYLSFSSDRMSAMDITDYIDRHVKDRLQTLPGVAEARMFGDRAYAMRIWLDPERLAAYAVTPQDVEAALRRENVEVPAGLVESQLREFTVLSQTDLQTPLQFENMVIRKTGTGYLVRLADVGRAEIAPRGERRTVRFGGESAVSIGVVKQATANPLDISHDVRKRLQEIIDALPEGMRGTVAYDRSLFIEKSINNVYHTIGEAVALVVLIIFIFLRSFRATLVPLVTIPVSLIGAFALMSLFGFTINTLTLLAMVLAIGLVVDDAIVMLENIFRHVEEGKTPIQASLLGANEIGFTVVAMTLTLAAVYVPIGFMGGTTGRLFTEFALALAGAVLVSGFVALTATPMMCSLLLRRNEKHGALYRAVENGIVAMTRGYKGLLTRLLGMRPLLLLVGLAVAGSGYLFFSELKRELAPFEDQGTIVTIFTAPEGSTLEYTDGYARQIESILASVPELERYFVVIGFPSVSQGVSFSRMVPWGERERTQQEVVQSIRGRMFAIPGMFAFPVNPPPLGQNPRAKPIELVIQTTQPYTELQAMADRVMTKAAQYPGLANLDTDLRLNKPQLRIDVDRDKAADLGVSAEVLGRTLETLLGGRQVTRFKKDGKQYDVVVQIADRYRSSPADLPGIYVRGSGGAAGGGQLIQIANLVRVSETVTPRELNHFNKLRSVTISANLGDGASVGEALAFLEHAARDELPGTAQIDFSGQSREFKTASAGIAMTFVLALTFIYLVLAAQFESFRNPFIIMLTVPLSIAGGLAALWLDGSTLNIYSQVGLVTLIGLITKHGILIVEFANQNRDRGADLKTAVVEAAALRLRPILMTTGAMVFGAIPLAVATGAGAESQQDIGLVIVGGITVGTFFTLFVIPAVYTYVASARPSVAPETLAGPEPAPQPAE
ncbi:MAG: efflux RND transporter permease subunit [Alphaproteobacteria bacterium]|nr:efflux RND transporter permease subunit [Alphaproteobacteria bacterium]